MADEVLNLKSGVRQVYWPAAIMLVMAVASSSQVRAGIALVDTADEAGLSIAIAESGPTSVTISNFTVSAMANVLVVLVEDKGASAVNSEPATLAWGSQTILKAVAQDNPTATLRGESIYYLFNPAPGTHNITAAVANAPNHVELTAYTLGGVDTTVSPKTGSGGNTTASVSFNVPGVVAGSWAAVNSTWSDANPPTITGMGGTTTMTDSLVVDNLTTIVTAGYISGLSAGSDTFTATWAASGQKNNLAVAVFTPLAMAINLTAAAASPNPVQVGTPVLLSVTASSTAGSITNVVVNASAIGGPSALPLRLSAGDVYTNSVTTIIPSIGAILPVTVQDSAGNVLAGSLRVVVETIADMQMDAFNKAYLVQDPDGQTYYVNSLSNRVPDGTWTFSIDIEGEEDAYERTHNPVQQQLINNLCTTWLIQTPTPWSWDGWNDDIGWFSLALVRGYQMTGDTNFLNAAEYGFGFAFGRGWDTNFNNGGIWEEQPANVNGPPNKNPLACDSNLQTVCMLYQSTTNPAYLADAELIYGWVRTNLFNPGTGIVYGSITTNGQVNTQPNLYNQGTFVDCANLLYNITGQQEYYNDAKAAVNGATNKLTTGGIFSNGATYLNTWAAEFARGMGHFVKDNNLWNAYYALMVANANAAWGCRRPDYNVSWSEWTQPTPTNTDLSANWAVNAVAMMQATPTGPATNFTLNYGGAPIVQAGGSDWDNPGNWSPLGLGATLSLVANPASTFSVVAGSRLRTPVAADSVFPGTVLMVNGDGVLENGTVVTIGELRIKHTGFNPATNDYSHLALDGGEVLNGDTGLLVLQGWLDVQSNSVFYIDNNDGRADQVDAWVTGAGNLFWHDATPPGGTNDFNVTGAANTFSGQWIVDQGGLLGSGAGSLGTNNLIVGTNTFVAAVETLYNLNNTNASLILGANGKMYLHQTNHFASVIINGTPLTNGTYSFAALNSAYPTKFPAAWARQTGSTFSTGSGQIIVGNAPPPPPRISNISLTGTALSLSVTNGAAGGPWILLQSTNVALPLSQWQTNITGTFDGSGNLSTNLPNTATNLQEFYRFKVL
jgi:hypothetical protein